MRGDSIAEAEGKQEIQEVELLDDIIEEKVTSRVEPIDRAKNRENGLKENNKPLIWKYAIEEYTDEGYPINERAVLRIFTEKVERVYAKRRACHDQFYNKLRHNKPERQLEPSRSFMAESRLLMESPIVLARQRLRAAVQEENRLLNSTRRLHVQLKQTGYSTQAAAIFSVAAKEYILRKRSLVSELEGATNRLSAIYAQVLLDARYAQKCAEFLERKTPIA